MGYTSAALRRTSRSSAAVRTFAELSSASASSRSSSPRNAGGGRSGAREPARPWTRPRGRRRPAPTPHRGARTPISARAGTCQAATASGPIDRLGPRTDDASNASASVQPAGMPSSARRTTIVSLVGEAASQRRACVRLDGAARLGRRRPRSAPADAGSSCSAAAMSARSDRPRSSRSATSRRTCQSASSAARASVGTSRSRAVWSAMSASTADALTRLVASRRRTPARAAGRASPERSRVAHPVEADDSRPLAAPSSRGGAPVAAGGQQGFGTIARGRVRVAEAADRLEDALQRPRVRSRSSVGLRGRRPLRPHAPRRTDRRARSPLRVGRPGSRLSEAPSSRVPRSPLDRAARRRSSG